MGCGEQKLGRGRVHSAVCGSIERSAGVRVEIMRCARESAVGEDIDVTAIQDIAQ